MSKFITCVKAFLRTEPPVQSKATGIILSNKKDAKRLSMAIHNRESIFSISKETANKINLL